MINTYKFINKPVFTPPGTISSYLGNSDPDGWIICDGTTRTVTDGRYAELAIILNQIVGTNSNNANNITPPNLQEKMLYGKTVPTTNILTTGGSSTVTLTIDNIPSHTHIYYDAYFAMFEGYIFPGGSTVYGSAGIDDDNGFIFRTQEGGEQNTPALISTKNSIGSAGNPPPDPLPILPPYRTINFIIKY